MIKRLKLIMLLVVLGLTVNVLKAEEVLPSSGVWPETTIESGTHTINLTGNISLRGCITVKNGASLTINNLDSSIRNIFNEAPVEEQLEHLFVVMGGASLIIDGGTKGIIIGGGASFNSANFVLDENGFIKDTLSFGTPNRTMKNTAIANLNGTLSLTKVTVQNVCNYNKDSNNKSGTIVHDKGTTTIKNCTITKCKQYTGAGVFARPGSTGTVTIENTTFQYCMNTLTVHGTHGGTIRAWGTSHVDLNLKNVTVNMCYSQVDAAGLYWPANEEHDDHFATLTIDGCEFYKNKAATQNAGGLDLCGTVKFVNNVTKVHDNVAATYGGGISIRPYNSGAPAGAALNVVYDITDMLEVYGNNAQRGGGIAFYSKVDAGTGYPTTLPAGTSFEINLDGASVHGNHANNTTNGNGGGIYLFNDYEGTDYSFTFNLNKGSVYENTAKAHGGGIYLEGWKIVSSSDPSDVIQIYDNAAVASGGGMYINSGTDYTMNSGRIYGNTTQTGGGGVYMKSGNFTMNKGVISSNEAKNNGGGLYIQQGNVSISNGTISENTAKTLDGGGFYVLNGTVTLIKGEGESDKIEISSNNSRNGGGFYANQGDVTIKGASIFGNKASNKGGGVYSNGGTFNLTDGTIGKNGEANQAVNGGGVYANGGEVIISSGLIQYNSATNGGGLYMQGTDAGNKAIANFSNGSFTGNTATTAGGGIYLANYSELYMSGTSSITGNSAGVKGGGVFKTAGSEHSKLQVSGTSLQVVNNTANSQRNNVYLDGYSDYITVDPAAGISDQVTVGISVNVNSTADLPTPVIHCDDVSKLTAIFNMLKTSTGASGVFDDASKYLAVYQSHPAPFNDKEIFFIATWIAEVTEPQPFDATRISTPDELAWFMVLVNGLNGQTANPNLNGTVINDIDMSAYYWTPIGEWNHGDAQAPHSIYGGTFDGQGHTISGVSTCGVINYYNYGLFGHTGSTADIRNVVLADCDFTSGESKRMGNLIAEMDGGTVSNCIVSGKLNPSGSETQEHDEHYCVVGGLIGETKNGAIIRNCIATEQIQAEPIVDEFYLGMQAFTVGGLVGMSSASTVIENCFANPEIHHGGSKGNETTLEDANRFVGGLVGENLGTVNNCYVRFERSNELAATVSKFGMFAGKNNGTIDKCYYPDESLRSIMVGGTPTPNQPLVNAGSDPLNYGEYNTTIRPYYYKHNDNLVTKIGGAAVGAPVSLLAKLNEWVDGSHSAKDGDAPTYSHWMRTCASPINDDYPVLEYDNLAGTMGYTTIASRDGINMEYNKSLNTMIGKYNTNGSALFVYNTPDEEINKSTAIPLYVGEDAALQLKSGTGITNAYVGITLDNSKSKTVGAENGNQFNWHMFSTPLTVAPLGVDYQNNHTAYNYWNSEDIPNFGFYPEGNESHGYFPSKTFGTDGTDGTDYYAEWDYYTYYEPHYHWINFKRNSESHYHQDTDNPLYPNHASITYTNETELVQGKGYLLATKEETYLQCNGTLNNGDVTIALDYTEDNHPVYRGCNLLGNPYQSYLNFDNTGLSSYAVLDEDLGGYAAYTKGASRNAYPTVSREGEGITAPGKYIHMHQGFFVAASAAGQSVTFTPGMCDIHAAGSFRGEEQPAYPLVNLAVTEADGSREFVTIELDRPDNGGAVKMKGLRNGSSLLYTHVDGEDYSIAFMPSGTTTAAVRFETLEEGTFTMNWNTQNGSFSYLHLIDNMTGMDIDCLASDEYKFKASSEDYASRFKLVFSYTGVEENEAETEDFAFLMNGNLIVNGEGTADIFDITGRLISSTRLTDSQNTLSLPALTQGLYMIRLSNGNGSKVQKIVIK